MSFRERERNRLIRLRDPVFKDPGSGLFFGKPRNFVLNDAALNLWDGVRWDAIEYFKDKGIKWWQGTENGPTGHLLSSQIACVKPPIFSTAAPRSGDCRPAHN